MTFLLQQFYWNKCFYFSRLDSHHWDCWVKGINIFYIIAVTRLLSKKPVTRYVLIATHEIPFTPHPCSSRYYSLFSSHSNKTYEISNQRKLLNYNKDYCKSTAVIILAKHSNAFIQNQELYIERLIQYISQVLFLLRLKLMYNTHGSVHRLMNYCKINTST